MRVKNLLLLALVCTIIIKTTNCQSIGIRFSPGYSFFKENSNIDIFNDDGQFTWEVGLDLYINIGGKGYLEPKSQLFFSLGYSKNNGGSLKYATSFYQGGWRFWTNTNYDGSEIFYLGTTKATFSLDYFSFSLGYQYKIFDALFLEVFPTINFLTKVKGDLKNNQSNLNITELDISEEINKINFFFGFGLGVDLNNYNIPISISLDYQLGSNSILKEGSNEYKTTDWANPGSDTSKYKVRKVTLSLVLKLNLKRSEKN